MRVHSISKPLHYKNLDLYYIKPEKIEAKPIIIRIIAPTYFNSDIILLILVVNIPIIVLKIRTPIKVINNRNIK